MATKKWSDEEVLHLIKLWGEEDTQQQLVGAKSYRHVYVKLARALQMMGFERGAEQCRAKIMNLKAYYRVLKNKHNKTGEIRSNWKYFNALAAVLDCRPPTRPSVAMDTCTSGQPDDDKGEELNESEEEDEGSVEQSDVSTDTAEDTRTWPSCLPSPTSSSPVKGKKRKYTNDESREAMMVNMMKEVISSQKESKQIFLEMEEKRLKYEAEQRKEDREFQLRMMSTLFCNHRTDFSSDQRGPDQRGPYHPSPSFSDSHIDT